MPRGKRKYPKTFFKIKEKLVLIPSKKFVGKKIFGVICLILGSLILSFSAIYFYLIPVFFPKQLPVVLISEERQPFFPKKIIIPSQGLDFSIIDGKIIGETPSGAIKIKEGSEMFVLAEKEYRTYLISKSQIKISTASSNLILSGDLVELEISLSAKPKRNLLISGERVK